MKLGTLPPRDNQGAVRFTFLSFSFSKPDQKLEEEFKWPDEKDLISLFAKYDLVNLSFDYYRPFGHIGSNLATEVTIEFDSNSYDGRVSKSIEELFELVCNRFGFDSYDYTFGSYKVTFTV